MRSNGQRTVRVCAKKKKAVVVLPGLLNNSDDYGKMVQRILSATNGGESSSDGGGGTSCVVARVRRADWLRNASGFLTRDYWAGTLKPRPTVNWYLERIDTAVAEAAASCGEDGEIVLLSHSAGGWLGRVWMEANENHEKITTYVSLGSPQLPPPGDVFDQTRGILTHLEATIPGCHHSNVRYVTISGRWKRGAASFDANNADAFVVGLTYKQVCGSADVWGDGITPEQSAHLPGSEKIVLEDCYHSPVGSEESDSSRLWYGSEAMLSQWIDRL